MLQKKNKLDKRHFSFLQLCSKSTQETFLKDSKHPVPMHHQSDTILWWFYNSVNKLGKKNKFPGKFMGVTANKTIEESFLVYKKKALSSPSQSGGKILKIHMFFSLVLHNKNLELIGKVQIFSRYRWFATWKIKLCFSAIKLTFN